MNKTSIICSILLLSIAVAWGGNKQKLIRGSKTAVNKDDTSFVPTHFITRNGNKLYDGNTQWLGMGFNGPDLIFHGTDFQVQDFMQSLSQMGMNCVRLYSFGMMTANDSVRLTGNNSVHILAPGQYNDKAFLAIDRVLKYANDYGVKVIINFFDAHAFGGGGIGGFTKMYGKPYSAYYKDPQLIQAEKAFYDYLINRTNTLTKVKYKDDKAILGWQLGNELEFGGSDFTNYLAPDGLGEAICDWTLEMAAYIKSKDPNHLVIDGRANRYLEYDTNTILRDKEIAVLKSSDVDICDIHYSPRNHRPTMGEAAGGAAMATRVVLNAELICGKYNKVLIAGEGPSFAAPEVLRSFLQAGFANTRTTGVGLSVSMSWSLRSHYDDGGFTYHREAIIPDPDPGAYTDHWWSWHFPGLPSGDAYWETQAMTMFREEAYRILHRQSPPPPYPVCAPPVLINVVDQTDIRFRGSAGGKNYDIQRSDDGGKTWNTIITGYVDDVNVANNKNAKMVNDNTATAPCVNTLYRVRANNSDGVPSDWSAPLKFGTTNTPPKGF